MSNFAGGSAFSMAQQVAMGVLLVTERTLRRMRRPDLDKLGFEIDRLLRDIRSQPASLDDTLAIQQRNRKIQRLNTSRMMLQAFRLHRR